MTFKVLKLYLNKAVNNANSDQLSMLSPHHTFPYRPYTHVFNLSLVSQSAAVMLCLDVPTEVYFTLEGPRAGCAAEGLVAGVLATVCDEV